MKKALEALKILREFESRIDAYDWMKGEVLGITGERIKKAIQELENFDNELERLRLQVCVTSAVSDTTNLRWEEAYSKILGQQNFAGGFKPVDEACKSLLGVLIKNNFWNDVCALDLFQNKSIEILHEKVAFSQNSLFFQALNIIGFDVIAECIELEDKNLYGCTIYNISKTTHEMLEEGIQYGCHAYADGSFSFIGFEQPTNDELEQIKFIISSNNNDALKEFISEHSQNKIRDFIDLNKG